MLPDLAFDQPSILGDISEGEPLLREIVIPIDQALHGGFVGHNLIHQRVAQIGF